MEITLPPSIRVTVDEQSQIAEARRISRTLAEQMGFEEARAEQVAIAVTEAATNLVKHTKGGEILLWGSFGDESAARGTIEFLALDRGPGMASVEACLRDGFSTGGTRGEGLGAIQRLATASDFYSVNGVGTAVLARWTERPMNGNAGVGIRAPRFQIGAVNVHKPGQEVCGDSWGMVRSGNALTVLVADGLGHGPEAQKASMEAVRTLDRHPDLRPAELLKFIHLALRPTRGAAVAVALIEPDRGTLTYAGIGNISAQIYAGVQPGPRPVSINGTAGFQVHRIQEFSHKWPERGMLVLYSDGLSMNANLEKHPGLALRDPSLIAGVLYRDFARGSDDATVVVVKAS
jgi:anti-sigma regulatory factor (Ser/Thr protein kinase)